VRLRAGRADESEALGELALRSKGHWGYDEAFLDACRNELRVGGVAFRRVIVAEDGGGVLGFATLDGRPPHGALGMLFVEPAVIGRGYGRLLYRRVLAEAGSAGFVRLEIDSDPHATGFYRAMGAEPRGSGDGLPGFVAWPPRPEPSWVAAWTGGRPAVHVGNAAEFNGLLPHRDHYSCLAVLSSPHPAAVVLPQPVDGAWIRELADALGWGEVEVHSGIAEDGRISEAIADRPSLSALLTSHGSPVLPWGRTAGFARIVPSPDGLLKAVRKYESKRGAHELFEALAPDHPGIVVPQQRPAGSRRALLRALRKDVPLVLKREYAVGGAGTLIVTSRTRRLRAVARHWARDQVVIEEYVDGSGPFRDPTFNAVIDADGAVHPVGVGLMRIEGTRYQGVTIGPGALPESLAVPAARFGAAVGERLASDGYRGWFDVDFVTGPDGRLAPTEINLRLTGPAAAFNLQARLDRLRGGHHFVRALDHLPLGARLPPAALKEHLDRVREKVEAAVFVTIPSPAYDPGPYFGVALAARTLQDLDEAEAVLREANRALSEMFIRLPPAPGPAWPPRTRRPRPRRS